MCQFIDSRTMTDQGGGNAADVADRSRAKAGALGRKPIKQLTGPAYSPSSLAHAVFGSGLSWASAQQLRRLGDIGGEELRPVPEMHLRNSYSSREAVSDPGRLLRSGDRERSPSQMTPSRTRSFLSRSIALVTALVRWRAPGCRYPTSDRARCRCAHPASKACSNLNFSG